MALSGVVPQDTSLNHRVRAIWVLQMSWTWALPWIARDTALTQQCRMFNSADTHGRMSVLPAPGELAAMEKARGAPRPRRRGRRW